MGLSIDERLDALAAQLDDVQTELRSLAELTASDRRVTQVEEVLAQHAARLSQIERHAAS